ncbi:MAG TPA: F0F1 ATP synthase subunit epsilon [Afipia sp.]
MANTFHFDLVSPEKIAFSGEVEQVDIPGVEGDFGVLAGHSPLVASVRPGVMIVTVNGKHEKIIVLGGLAEVSEKGLTVLADTATSLAELDRVAFDKQIAEMEERLRDEEPGNALDRALARLDHFKVIQQNITSTAMH